MNNSAFYSDFNIKKVKLFTLRAFIFKYQNNYMQYIQHIDVNIFCRIVHNSFIFGFMVYYKSAKKHIEFYSIVGLNRGNLLANHFKNPPKSSINNVNTHF